MVAILKQQRKCLALGVAGALLAWSAGPSTGAEQCKPKTAGYFTQMAGFNRQAVSPVDLVGITQSLTGDIGNPARGRALIADPEKGDCLACHQASAFDDHPAQGNLGANLNGVGNRYTEAQLRQILVDPNPLIADTVMPAYHKKPDFARLPDGLTGETILSAGEIEDIVAFLKNLK